MTQHRSIGMAMCGVLLALAACGGGAGVETDHGGHTLGEWMKMYWQWNISGSATARSGDIVFLPLPNATDPDGDHIFTGEINTDLAAADGFALPMFVWVGETYMGGMPANDDPALPPATSFTGMRVVVTLDGVNIIDSMHDNLQQYFFAAQNFDATIPYAMPTSYGAIGAIFVKGIGFLHAPLAVGTHTLHLEEFNSDPMVNTGFSNTWHITVR